MTQSASPDGASLKRMQSVYALGDPRTNEIRYIGIAQDVYKRYAQHLNNPHANNIKNSWMDALKNAGLVPTLTILEADIDEAMARFREDYWIQYHLDQGAPLTNRASRLAAEKPYTPTKVVTIRKHTHIELKVREVARSKGISMGKLGRMADVDVKTIRRVYHDPATSITLMVLNQFANALEVDVSELLTSVEDE